VSAPLLPPTARYLVLYDGVCGICNWAVKFILPRDPRGLFVFAPLQSALARTVLERNGIVPDVDSFRVVLAPFSSEERVLHGSRGVLEIWGQLSLGWRALSVVGRVVPTFLADALYRVFAKHRYRIWGRYDACLMPSASTRARFVALDEVELVAEPKVA
jgi:predicted DCC family thiol-disulfide oxidoreductase YuxK